MKIKHPKLRIGLIALTMGSSALLPSCGNMAQGIGSVGTRSAVGNIGYDPQEQKILGQARGTGAVLGATAGYFLAQEMGISSGWGAAIGGLAGAAAGDAIGTNQANKAKAKRLSNDQMRKMITATKKNNARLRAYNYRVAKRIQQIKKATPAQRYSMARNEKRSVNTAIKQTDQVIAQRESALKYLAGSQKSQLASQINIAKSQRSQLAAHRASLSRIEVASR